MRSIFLAAIVLFAGTARLAPAQTCPFTSVATTSFGQGTGFLAPATLTAALDASSCSLVFDTIAPTCCNTFFTSQFLAVGLAPIPGGLPLPAPPFIDGSLLLVSAFDIVGPFASGSFPLPLPPVPGLIGIPIDVQSIPVLFTTINMSTDLAVTNGVELTLQ